ncbi:MAG: hypothetical protein WCA78_05835 [Rhizomicrobium sp.]|jgi:hypothetical protein
MKIILPNACAVKLARMRIRVFRYCVAQLRDVNDKPAAASITRENAHSR